eukprot:gene9216-1303_t
MAKIICSLNWYGHFCIAHVHIHHKNVGTPNDPSTAKYNENL